MKKTKQLQRLIRILLIISFSGAAILALPNCSPSNKKPKINTAGPGAERDGGEEETPGGEKTTPEGEEQTTPEGDPETAAQREEQAPCPPGQTCAPTPADDDVPRDASAADNKIESCVFEKTYIAGASVSAGFDTMKFVQTLMVSYGGFGEDNIERLLQDANSNKGLIATDRLSPSMMLAQTYGSTLKDISEPMGAPLGSEQIEKMLGEDRANFDEASVVIGVDLFYWDSILANEDPALCTAAKEALTQLVIEAAGQEKPLIIGNIPDEKEENVLDQFRQAVPAWKPPLASCREELNNHISQACAAEMDCYVVDFFNVVNDLNDDGEIIVPEGEGQVSYELSKVRTDGVHLTEVGSMILQNHIKDKLHTKRPLCAGEAE